MWWTLIFKFFTSTLVDFVQKNWKLVLAAIAFGTVIWMYNSHVNNLTDAAYKNGLAAQKAVCDAKMSELEDEHRQYVTDTEKAAKAAADELEKLRGDSKKKVDELNKELDKKQKELNKHIYGQDGKVIKCPELEALGEIHLGSDFSTQWNKYNKELVK